MDDTIQMRLTPEDCDTIRDMERIEKIAEEFPSATCAETRKDLTRSITQKHTDKVIAHLTAVTEGYALDKFFVDQENTHQVLFSVRERTDDEKNEEEIASGTEEILKWYPKAKAVSDHGDRFMTHTHGEDISDIRANISTLCQGNTTMDTFTLTSEKGGLSLAFSLKERSDEQTNLARLTQNILDEFPGSVRIGTRDGIYYDNGFSGASARSLCASVHSDLDPHETLDTFYVDVNMDTFCMGYTTRPMTTKEKNNAAAVEMIRAEFPKARHNHSLRLGGRRLVTDTVPHLGILLAGVSMMEFRVQYECGRFYFYYIKEEEEKEEEQAEK